MFLYILAVLKRTISIIILLVFFFDVAGEFVVFKIRQASIKREIKRQIKRSVPKEELYTIIVTQSNENELVWKEKNEFVYRGSMYDIVTKETSNDTTTYYCINDLQEEHLFAHLNELVKNKTGNKNPIGKIVDNLVKLFSAVDFKTDNVYHFTYNSPSDFCTCFILGYVSPIISISSPPPQFSV